MNDMWVCVAFWRWMPVAARRWIRPNYDGPGTPPPTVGGAIITAAQHEGLGGVYGNPGLPPSRLGAATWTDLSGNFWLFGGSTGGHYYNDFWKYDTTDFTGNNYTVTEGTWTRQRNAPLSIRPVSTRPAHSFRARAPTPRLGPMPPETSGSSAGPDTTAKAISVSSTICGNTTALPGFGFRAATPTCEGQNGIYGAQGVAASTNMPGGRHEAVTWTDANGNLWLFGGEGNDSVGTAFGILNDLWMYNIASSQWTWVAGRTPPTRTAPTRLKQSSAPSPLQRRLERVDCRSAMSPTLPRSSSNQRSPGSRWGASGWIDASGNLWLFGGWGLDSIEHRRQRRTQRSVGLYSQRNAGTTRHVGLDQGFQHRRPEWRLWRRNLSVEYLLSVHSGRPQQLHCLGRWKRSILALRRSGLRLHEHQRQWRSQRYVALRPVSLRSDRLT